MATGFVQNAALRGALINGYRIYARSQVWRRGPTIFINSIPKAGTHLMTAELEKFPGVQNSRLHIEIAKNQLGDETAEDGYPVLDYAKIDRAIATVRGRQFFSGHLGWAPELMNSLHKYDLKSLFMTRDPRDVLVSRYHYIMGLRRHWLHDYLTSAFDTTEARYWAFIDGKHSQPFIYPMKKLLSRFIPWADEASVSMIRFEDLVGERGGGSADAKRIALQKMSDHCELPRSDIDRIVGSATTRTATLRKGKTDAWRQELPASIVEYFHTECVDLLTAFGYDAE